MNRYQPTETEFKLKVAKTLKQKQKKQDLKAESI